MNESRARLRDLPLETWQSMADRLRQVGARAIETDLAMMIADEVEYCLQTGKHTDSVAEITDHITFAAWSGRDNVDDRFKRRIVRVCLAFLGATYNRTNHIFRWEGMTIQGS